jgi:glycosyltransferase involved in cell wall biosynthesis
VRITIDARPVGRWLDGNETCGLAPERVTAIPSADASGLHRERGRSNLPQLVLVGKKAGLYGETLKAVEEDGVGNSVVMTGYVSEGDLPALYTGALCFAYSSYYEGFGLPPLEAARCGTAVPTGYLTGLPESAGSGGLTADPFYKGAIRCALARLIEDAPLRAAPGARTPKDERLRLAGHGPHDLASLQESDEREVQSAECGVMS